MVSTFCRPSSKNAYSLKWFSAAAAAFLRGNSAILLYIILENNFYHYGAEIPIEEISFPIGILNGHCESFYMKGHHDINDYIDTFHLNK